MAKTTTYSFTDVSCALNFDGIVPYVITGEGVGSITVTMSTDKTTHDVSADGSIMVSKIAGNNGTIAISLQQTSYANTLLKLWYNYLLAANATSWANNSLTITNLVTGDVITATGVSPQKRADLPLQAQGQQRVWNLMAADIQEV